MPRSGRKKTVPNKSPWNLIKNPMGFFKPTNFELNKQPKVIGVANAPSPYRQGCFLWPPAETWHNSFCMQGMASQSTKS